MRAKMTPRWPLDGFQMAPQWQEVFIYYSHMLHLCVANRSQSEHIRIIHMNYMFFMCAFALALSICYVCVRLGLACWVSHWLMFNTLNMLYACQSTARLSSLNSLRGLLCVG